jgi:hypothetical protein
MHNGLSLLSGVEVGFLIPFFANLDGLIFGMYIFSERADDKGEQYT